MAIKLRVIRTRRVARTAQMTCMNREQTTWEFDVGEAVREKGGCYEGTGSIGVTQGLGRGHGFVIFMNRAQ